jgi:hypothetical protein
MSPYWLVKYGDVERISDRCLTSTKAMMQCFGIVSPDIKVVSFNKKWRYLTNAEKEYLRSVVYTKTS